MLYVVSPSTRVYKGQEIEITVISDNPGEINLTYSSNLSGPSSITIPGDVKWYPNLETRYQCGWYGPAAVGNLTAYRDNVSICFDFDLRNFFWLPSSSGFIHILNYGRSTTLYNWALFMYVPRGTGGPPAFIYTQTNAPPATTNESKSFYLDSAVVRGKYTRFVLLLSGTSLTLYTYASGTKYTQTLTRTAPTGLASTPTLAFFAGSRFAYFQGLLPNDSSGVDKWLSGDCPNGYVVYYPCNEEVPDNIIAAPYDAGGLYDGTYGVDSLYIFEKTPRFREVLSPVSEKMVFPVTLTDTGVATITASRRRQGVPDRASEDEKYENAQPVSFYVYEASEPTQETIIKVGPDQTYKMYEP